MKRLIFLTILGALGFFQNPTRVALAANPAINSFSNWSTPTGRIKPTSDHDTVRFTGAGVSGDPVSKTITISTFANFSSPSGGKVSPAPGSNTIQVIGATVGKVGGKPTMTITPGSVGAAGLASNTFTAQQLMPDLVTQGPWVDSRSAAWSIVTALAVTYNRPLHITQQINITSDTDLSAVPEIDILQGGQVNVSTGVTLTLPVNFHAGLTRVFYGSGSVIGLRGTRYAEWWGADPTGATSSASAVQSAIDATPNDGISSGTIVALGDYLIDSTVTVDKPTKFTSVGAMYASGRYINLTNTTIHMFNVIANGVQFANVQLRGAGKTGTSMAITVGDGTTNYDMFHMENTLVVNFAVGAEIKTQNWEIRNGTSFSTCGTGVLLTGLAQNYNRRNGYISNSWLHSCDTGISAPNSWFSIGISGNDFNACGQGITGYFSRSTITSNNFHNETGTCINVTSAGDSTDLGIIIVGNTMHGSATANAGHGIQFTGSYATISDNSVNIMGGHGYLINGSYNKLTGNTAKDNDFFTTGLYDGFNITGTYNVIEANTSRTSMGGASYQRYGIRIETGTGNIVANNVVQSNHTAQISDGGTSTDIRNNQGYITSSKGSATVGASSYTVTVTHGLSITPPTGSIQITPVNVTNVSKWGLANVGATTFDITVDVQPGGTGQGFWWKIN